MDKGFKIMKFLKDKKNKYKNKMFGSSDSNKNELYKQRIKHYDDEMKLAVDNILNKLSELDKAVINSNNNLVSSLDKIDFSLLKNRCVTDSKPVIVQMNKYNSFLTAIANGVKTDKFKNIIPMYNDTIQHIGQLRKNQSKKSEYDAVINSLTAKIKSSKVEYNEYKNIIYDNLKYVPTELANDIKLNLDR